MSQASTWNVILECEAWYRLEQHVKFLKMWRTTKDLSKVKQLDQQEKKLRPTARVNNKKWKLIEVKAEAQDTQPLTSRKERLDRQGCPNKKLNLLTSWVLFNSKDMHECNSPFSTNLNGESKQTLSCKREG